MRAVPAPIIVIRHISGSKANQVEEFPFAGGANITFGRDSGNNVLYDSSRDDVVSRNHAIIRVSEGEPYKFTLEDLNSSNGTFLNKGKISGNKELFPEDIVALGKTGPSFTFDVQPRPPGVGSRTRVIEAVDLAATSVVKADTGAVTAYIKGTDTVRAAAAPPEEQPLSPYGKEVIGKETLLHEIAKERGSANRTLMYSLGSFAALSAVTVGAFYLKESRDVQSEQQSIQQVRQATEEQSQAVQSQSTSELKQRLGMSPQDIVREYGDATAKVKVEWRLFDQKTGRPIFQRMEVDKGDKKRQGDNQSYPAYVRFGNDIYPLLTLDDDSRTNRPISGRGEGTAFVVSEQGFLLTNKHLGAAWRLPFLDSDSKGILWESTGNRKNPWKKSLINLDDDAYSKVKKWVPETGGLLFTDYGVVGNIPDPAKNERRNFTGRNENLEMTFPGQRLGINGTLVRYSNDSDVALVKIESPQALHKVELANEDDPVDPGERAIVMGYPGIAAETFAESQTIENGQFKRNLDIVPAPYVSEGIVALVSGSILTSKGVTYGGAEGDIFQLTINSTGAGNSGGPVFDSSGKVIGIFTYTWRNGVTTNTAAVPIKYGLALLGSHPR